jgi:hypothetical protein
MAVAGEPASSPRDAPYEHEQDFKQPRDDVVSRDEESGTREPDLTSIERVYRFVTYIATVEAMLTYAGGSSIAASYRVRRYTPESLHPD